MTEIICIKCKTKYKFSEKWRGNAKNYICRTCKIKNTTRSQEFKEKQSKKSKRILSNLNIRARMSQRATINNINNSNKISKTLINYYKNTKLRQILSDRAKANWQNKEYSSKIIKKLKECWKNPVYRGKVLGSRSRLKKQHTFIIKQLNIKKLTYNQNFILSHYIFDFKIGKNTLFDEEIKEEKQIFLAHYFPEINYTNDLTEAEKFEN